MNINKPAFLVLLLSVCSWAGNGFYSYYNGRNHSELKWQVIETEHAKIMYHQDLEDEAKQAAKAAEVCYGPITQNLDHEPPNKIPIFISDQDDITNGFSVANKFIAIWVNVNDYTDWTTGSDKWMRMVIGHEMVHYIHFSAINTWMGLVGFGFSGTPSWFLEGMAQYESETWNVHRGDLLLRTAVIEDEMDFSSGKWITNGRLMYAEGNSIVRYIADQYGDSTLVKILNERQKTLWIPRYSFAASFKKALDIDSFDEFYREWRRHVNIYYNTYYGQKEDINDYAKSLDLPLVYIKGLQISPNEEWLSVSGITNLDEPLNKLCIVKNDSTKETHILVQSNAGNHFSFSPDGSQIAYSRIRRGEHGSLQSDLFITDLDGNSKRITQDAGAEQPDWSPDGSTLVCIKEEKGTTNLYTLAPNGSDFKQLTHFSGDVQLQTPRWSPDGKSIIAAIFDESGKRDIALVDAKTGSMTKLTNDEQDDRSPVWSPDGNNVAFTSYRGGTPDVYTVPVNASASDSIGIRQVTDVPGGLYSIDWVQDSLVTILNDSRRKTVAMKLSPNREPESMPLSINPRYTSWMTHRPPHDIPPLDIKDQDEPVILKQYKYSPLKNIQHYMTIPVPSNLNDSWGFYFMTYWTEPLVKHNFTGFGFFDVEQPKDSRFLVSYINKTFYPTIYTTLLRMPSTGQIIDDKLLVEETVGGVIDIEFPLDFGDNLYSNHTFSVNGQWLKNDPYDVEDFKDSVIPVEKTTIGEFGFAYTWKKQRPNYNNIIHPSQGMGFQVQASFADKKWNSDLTYKHALADGYINIPFPDETSIIYIRAKGEAADGRLPSQHFIGFDKYDQPDFGMGLKFSERERLRGIKQYLFGDRLWMATVEYRMDLIPDLGWQAAGVRLGRVTLAGFADFGSTWFNGETALSDADIHKTYGVEFKNAVDFGGFVFAHEYGWAWLWDDNTDAEAYYRIRAVVPF